MALRSAKTRALVATQDPAESHLTAILCTTLCTSLCPRKEHLSRNRSLRIRSNVSSVTWNTVRDTTGVKVQVGSGFGMSPPGRLRLGC